MAAARGPVVALLLSLALFSPLVCVQSELPGKIISEETSGLSLHPPSIIEHHTAPMARQTFELKYRCGAPSPDLPDYEGRDLSSCADYEAVRTIEVPDDKRYRRAEWMVSTASSTPATAVSFPTALVPLSSNLLDC